MLHPVKHTSVKVLFLGLLLLGLLSSCASTKGAYVSKYKVFVTNTKRVSLLPTRCMDGSMDSLMLFNGSFGDTKFSMQAYIYSDDAEMEVVLLNEFGAGMGTLFYADDSVELDSALFPSSLKPEYIVADFQNAFYDAQALKSNYESNGLSFTVAVDSQGRELRQILNKGTVIESIEKFGGVTTITNRLRGYTYILTEAEE